MVELAGTDSNTHFIYWCKTYKYQGRDIAVGYRRARQGKILKTGLNMLSVLVSTIPTRGALDKHYWIS